MAVRTPLKLDGSNLREMTAAEITAIAQEAARLYGQNPSVGVTVVGSGGNLGTITDTRLEAGAGSTGGDDFPSAAVTDDVSTITVNYSKLNTTTTTGLADWTNATYSYPLYYDGSDLREMSAADFGDTFIKPAIDDITGTTVSEGTYFISASNIVAGSTLVSSTPVFSDTRYNEPTLGSTLTVSYDITGGGGGGGGEGTSGSAGGSSTISGSGITTITSTGGSGGLGATGSSSNGAASYWGPGGDDGQGAAGDSGDPAPAGSYGAGGGGAFGGVDLSSGYGGGASTRSTGSFTVTSGTQITIVVGAGGGGGTGLLGGGSGAGGIVLLTVGGTIYEYSTPGTYNITPTGTVADLFYPEDNPVTITNYYLHKKNGNSTPGSIELPICYTKSGTNLQPLPTATILDALETMVRHYAVNVTGTKISYNINGTGVNQGTTMTDTRLDSSIYLTDYDGTPNDYRAQEIPTGAATTISTYNLKITQT